MQSVRIDLNWTGIDDQVKYQVYKGMRLWLQEREIVHRFEYDGGLYFPQAVIMDGISASAFKLIF